MNNQTNWIAHHGIKGQKWGVRRYQNEDGSLTSLGKKHYYSMSGKKLHKELKKQLTNRFKEKRSEFIEKDKAWKKKWEEAEKKWEEDADYSDALVFYDTKKGRDLYKKKPGANWRVLNYGYAYELGSRYVNRYLNLAGKDFYLESLKKDLGYDEKTAKLFVDKMLKANAIREKRYEG